MLCIISTGISGDDNNNDKDDNIYPLRMTHGYSPKDSYVNSEGLICSHMYHQQPNYHIMTEQAAGHYD